MKKQIILGALIAFLFPQDAYSQARLKAKTNPKAAVESLESIAGDANSHDFCEVIWEKASLGPRQSKKSYKVLTNKDSSHIHEFVFYDGSITELVEMPNPNDISKYTRINPKLMFHQINPRTHALVRKTEYLLGAKTKDQLLSLAPPKYRDSQYYVIDRTKMDQKNPNALIGILDSSILYFTHRTYQLETGKYVGKTRIPIMKDSQIVVPNPSFDAAKLGYTTSALTK